MGYEHTGLEEDGFHVALLTANMASETANIFILVDRSHSKLQFHPLQSYILQCGFPVRSVLIVFWFLFCLFVGFFYCFGFVFFFLAPLISVANTLV